MTHLSLFSGIGGLDLAAEWAGFRNLGQVEYADYQTKILEKHWPDVQRWRDIHEFSADEFFIRTGHKTVTVLSGGFPCQPHSVAGKRMASCDDRDLWPEMRRVIGEIKPKWVVAENVPGLLTSENGRFFGRVLRDFSEMGFDVGWGVTSAAGFGALHRRERVAIIAHTNSERLQGRMPSEKFKETNEQLERIYLHLLRYANEEHLSKSGFLRKYDGVRNRVDRTKSIGNAVVPQQFYHFFKFIKEFEEKAKETDKRR